MLLGRTSDSLVECRHCGVNLEEHPPICPECGSCEIATYDL